MAKNLIGNDISDIKHDDNEVVKKCGDESLDVFADVQERQDQLSMEPSPQEIHSDENEGQLDESRQSQQINRNSKNEDISVATPDVDIHKAQKDRGTESGLEVDDLTEETP